MEFHSRARGQVLDSELPRLQSRQHLRSPGLGRHGTRLRAFLSLQFRTGWAAVGLGGKGFGPGSYITLRCGLGLNLHQSIFFLCRPPSGLLGFLVWRPSGHKMLSGHSFSEALLFHILPPVATDAVRYLPRLLQSLTHPYFPYSAFSFKDRRIIRCRKPTYKSRPFCKGSFASSGSFCLSGS